MKIRVLSSREEINSLNKYEKIVHIAFRPSNKDMFSLIKACPHLKAIHLSHAYMKTISSTVEIFLSMQDVLLLEGEVYGYRKDVNEYYEIKPSVLTKIKELMEEGFSKDEIVNIMNNETRLGQDLIEILV